MYLNEAVHAACHLQADMCVAAAGAMVQGAVQRGPVMLQPSATAAGTRAMHSGGAAAAQAAAAQAAAAQAAAAQMAAKMTAPAADAYVMSGLQKGAAPAVCIKQETCSGCLAGCAFCGA